MVLKEIVSLEYKYPQKYTVIIKCHYIWKRKEHAAVEMRNRKREGHNLKKCVRHVSIDSVWHDDIYLYNKTV